MDAPAEKNAVSPPTVMQASSVSWASPRSLSFPARGPSPWPSPWPSQPSLLELVRRESPGGARGLEAAARGVRSPLPALLASGLVREALLAAAQPYLTELVAHVVAGGRGGRPRIIAAAQHLVRLPYSPEAFGRASLVRVVNASETDGRSLTSFAVKGLRDARGVEAELTRRVS